MHSCTTLHHFLSRMQAFGVELNDEEVERLFQRAKEARSSTILHRHFLSRMQAFGVELIAEKVAGLFQRASEAKNSTILHCHFLSCMHAGIWW